MLSDKTDKSDKPYKSEKPSLLLIDRRALHRERIKIRLDTLYQVKDFALLVDALRHAHLRPADAMVICEDQARGEDFRFLQAMRREPAFQTVPIIIILAEENTAQSTLALAAGASGCLAKPYMPSTLVALISAAINQACERQWDTLPYLPAAALKNSVKMFNAVAGMVERAEAIPYGDISSACQPLMETVHSDGIGDILRGIQAHDNYAYAHSLRVAVYLSVFGRNIGLPPPELAVLTTGGLLLDVGKTVIPPLLLNKSGNLTNAEYGVMQTHVGATMHVLAKCPGLPEGVKVIAAQHHEKLDGSGYPNALPGSKLNELARMAAIVDIFSALTDRRVYKAAMSAEAAFAIMAEEMTSQLDMQLMRSFRQILYDTHVAQAQTQHAA